MARSCPLWRRGNPTDPACLPPTALALLQLVCDLRANTPKDRRFLARHARALMPHTLPGWLVSGGGPRGERFAGAYLLPLLPCRCSTICTALLLLHLPA